MNKKTNNRLVWRIAITILNLLAIALSIILSWHYFKEGSMPGCGNNSSCDQVLSSRWSSLADIIPVSGLALGAYLALFVSSLNISTSIELSIRRLSWSVMTVLGGTIIGSAVWFTIVQKWIIGSFCIYCMATHITGFLLSALIIWRVVKTNETSKNEKPLIKPIRIFGFFLVGLLVSGIMATIQFVYTPFAVAQDNKTQSIQTKIDFQEAPTIGSPDAPYKVTVLFDYQCSHCQKIHFMLNEVIRQYNGELAFILYPTPLENSCNPYVPSSKDAFKNSCELSKIGLAVWRANREVYAKFETWMFTYETGSRWHPRSLDGVKAKAIELLGKDKLEDALADPWIDSYLQNGIQLFGQTIQNGKAAIPKMIYNNAWVIPEPYNANDLKMILQERLGVPKP